MSARGCVGGVFFFVAAITEISGCKSGIEPILQCRLAPSVGRASLRALFLFFRDFPVSAVDRQLLSPCSLCSGLCALYGLCAKFFLFLSTFTFQLPEFQPSGLFLTAQNTTADPVFN